MIARAAGMIWRVTYARYLSASAGALATDLSVFMILLTLGTRAMIASATGYCLGLVVHWLISSRFVFTHLHGLSAGQKRRKMLFGVSAVIGLTLTTMIVGLGERMHVDPRLAKLVAIGVSFQVTYWLRRTIVFA